MFIIYLDNHTIMQMEEQQQSYQLQSNEHPPMLDEQQNISVFSHRDRNYGKSIILKMNAYGQPIYMLGPHWYLFIATFLITIGLLIWQIILMKSHVSLVWVVGLIIISLLYAFTYLNIGLSYPGFAKQIQAPTPQQQSLPNFCTICNTIKIRNTIHCFDCGVCIQQFDHHCPWIGKCVGKNNLISFYIFTVMAIITLIIYFICASSMGKESSANDQPRVVG